MIVVENVAGRRLAAPKGSKYMYIAIVSIGGGGDGDSPAVTTAPVAAVVDSRIGVSISFRERLEIPVPQVQEDDSPASQLLEEGVTVRIASVCGAVDFGTAVCSASKKWFPLSSSCGEVLCTFTTASRRSGGAAIPRGAYDAAPSRMMGVPMNPSAANVQGTLTVTLASVEGIILPGSRIHVFATIRYGDEEFVSEAAASEVYPDGHAVRLNCEAKFALPAPHVRSRQPLIALNNCTDATATPVCLGIALVTLRDAPYGDCSERLTLPVQGHPSARVHVAYQITYLRPRKEGAGGRPASAYIRGCKPPPGKLASDSEADDERGVGSRLLGPRRAVAAVDQTRSRNATTTSSSGIRGGEIRQQCWGDDDSENDERKMATTAATTSSNASISDLVIQKVTERIGDVVGKVATDLMAKIASLETRVGRTEEMLMQMSRRSPITTYSSRGGRAPRAHATTTSSRPSSADSYDVSQSLVTETQLRGKFNEYDVHGVGHITGRQLIHFYRATSTFGAEESEEDIVKFLAQHCGSFAADIITFDDFARVSLKLAQR